MIIAPKVVKNSATKLAGAMEMPIEFPYDTGRRNFSGVPFIFKYGFSKPIQADEGAIVLNVSSSVNAVLDKVRTFQLFQDKDWVVPYTLDKNVAKQWAREGWSVFSRATATGRKSEGITVCNNISEVEKAPAIFWTRYVESTNEFRVNCWRNRALSIYDKGVLEANEGELFFNFRLFEGAENNSQLKDILNTIYERTKLDWYGVDFLRDDGGKLVLLEINTAPTLYPTTLRRLVSTINQEIFHK